MVGLLRAMTEKSLQWCHQVREREKMPGFSLPPTFQSPMGSPIGQLSQNSNKVDQWKDEEWIWKPKGPGLAQSIIAIHMWGRHFYSLVYRYRYRGWGRVSQWFKYSWLVKWQRQGWNPDWPPSKVHVQQGLLTQFDRMCSIPSRTYIGVWGPHLEPPHCIFKWLLL